MAPSVMIVDVGLGNVGAIQNILKYIGVESFRSDSPKDLEFSQKVILPGVGSFDAGISLLRKYDLLDSLRRFDTRDDADLLGICLGMQILLESSEEGMEEGLGLIRGNVSKFVRVESSMKIPHVGWNYSTPVREAAIVEGWDAPPRFYFTHSYHANCERLSDVIATTSYGYMFPSIIKHKNVCGVQFHPEKSHRYGMKLLSNFVNAS